MNGTLTIQEAATILKINPVHLRRRCLAGKVPGAFKVGKLWRIKSDELFKQGGKL